MKQVVFILSSFLLITATEGYASGPQTCDSVSIGAGNYYFTQGEDSTFLIQFNYIGSETLAYPTLQVQMDDTSKLVVDGFLVQSFLATDLLTFYVRYKQPNLPANTSVGGKLRITNSSLNPPLDCAVRLTIHVNSNTGIDQTTEAPFKVFPIPADREIILRTAAAEPQQYHLYSGMGQLIHSGFCFGTTTISLTGIPAGAYYLTHSSGWQQVIVVAPR